MNKNCPFWVDAYIAETAKVNGVDFYHYLVKLFTDFPNLDIHRNPDILNQYTPWSKMILAECGKKKNNRKSD